MDADLVSQGFFDVLGLRPVAGRFFAPEEHVPNAAPVLVVSEGFWHRALGGMAPDGTVLLDGIPFTLLGVAPASIASLARLLASFLYGVSATDPLTYALVAAALSLVAALASLLPARRATRVDPAISLRAE
jgi:hypothetical protein